MLDSYDTLDDMLHDVLHTLLSEKTWFTASRGRFTELFGCCLYLKNPRARLSRSEGKGKVFSALGELMWYLSGDTKLDFIDYYVPGQFQKESDDQHKVRSGYGERLLSFNGINQLTNVIALLRGKESSRRAVIQLFDATDLTGPYKSIPCTCTLQFIAREGRLNMFVSMRSNDAYIGLPHDVFSFTMLQELVARSIGLEVGEYKHCAGSLHLYEDNFEDAQKYIEEGIQHNLSMPPMPEGNPWASVAQFRDYEEVLRLGGEVEPHPEWDEYWRELSLLLEAYRASRRGDLKSLLALTESLRPTVYKMFVQARADRLTSTGLKSPATGTLPA